MRSFNLDPAEQVVLPDRFGLMQALAAQGNVAEAPRAYDTLCEILRNQLGISPGTSTRAVYEALVSA